MTSTSSTPIAAVEARAAAAGGEGKRDYVRRIFSEIAPRYDLLNHLLSFNVDRRWRRLAIREIPRSGRPDELLDRYGISSRHIVEAVRSTVTRPVAAKH